MLRQLCNLWPSSSKLTPRYLAQIMAQPDGTFLVSVGATVMSVLGSEEPLGLRMRLEGIGTIMLPTVYDPSELRSEFNGKVGRCKYWAGTYFGREFLHSNGKNRCFDVFILTSRRWLSICYYSHTTYDALRRFWLDFDSGSKKSHLHVGVASGALLLSLATSQAAKRLGGQIFAR